MGTVPTALTGVAGCAQIGGFFAGPLDRYEDKVDDTSRDYEQQQWLVETADKAASEQKVSADFEIMQKATYDPQVLESSVAFGKAAAGLDAAQCPDKTRLDRAVGMLEASILTNPEVIRLEKENQDRQDALVKLSNGFRLELPGDSEPVSRAIYSKTLGSEPDRAKREALYRKFNPARAQQWLAWGFRDLIKARNAEAKAAGYPDYYAYRFFRNQLDLANYRGMVAEIKTKLAPKMRRIIQGWGKHAGIGQVQAWDLRYLRDKASSGEINDLLKDAPETTPLDLARRFYSGLGISIDDYHFVMDLYPRPGKNTHAFTMGIVYPHVDAKGNVLPEPKADIRFLANLRKPVKWDDISTVIHELGHAVHSAEVRAPIGLFRGIGLVETEAIAMTFERMAASAEFMKTVIESTGKVPPRRIRMILSRQDHATRVEQAMVLLRQVFFSDFEYEMYRNPDADFAQLWSKMHREYWGVEIDPKLADWDVEHFLMSPAYVQNYAIGILMVEQIYASMLRDFKTSYRSTALGDKLKKVYFAPGEEFDYLALTQHFTGHPLSADAALHLLP
jgi:oligoendopeptidase F